MSELYRVSANKVTDKMLSLYPLLLEEETTANSYYLYVRYYKLRNQINKELSQLGNK